MNNCRVLVVEDDPICMGFIEQTLSAKGYTIIPVNNCSDAWLKIGNQKYQFDAILLDRGLPDEDGLKFLRRIKATPAFQGVPVIVETALAHDISIHDGFASGAYYYLTKPLNADLLLHILDIAIDQYRSDRALVETIRHQKECYYKYLNSAVFCFRTLDEAKNLAQALSQLCPEPERVIVGLQELLINAVEHGNLGITYKDKTELMLENRWREEVDKRLKFPDFATRQVEVRFEKHKTHLVIVIQDQGNGFDWKKYMQLDPERAFDSHGRGIALAKMMSFDSITYLGNGNTLVVTIDQNN